MIMYYFANPTKLGIPYMLDHTIGYIDTPDMSDQDATLWP